MVTASHRTSGLGRGLAGIIQCATCGVEHHAEALPPVCAVCADERQYLPGDGNQRWAAPGDFGGRIDMIELEADLWGLRVDGEIGIGQQAKVLVADGSCVMVDVPAAITAAAVEGVRELGTMRAIIPTHPHMFGLQSAWSAALGDAPVLVAAADADWLAVRPDALQLWEEDREILPAVLARQVGGHFPGSAVVRWPGGDGRGVLLSGDSIAANPDRRTVTFMRSYPNRIPLSGAVALRIARAVSPWTFERLYDNFSGHIPCGADEAVRFSAERYAAWAGGEHDDLTGPGRAQM